MPELPEVERVAGDLRVILIGKQFKSVTCTAPPTSVTIAPSLHPRTYESLLTGRTVRGVRRRGKNLLIDLSGELTLWVHLKMTGQFRWLKKSEPIDRHDLFTYSLHREREYHLRFNDYRRFGRHRLYPTPIVMTQKGLRELGPEPHDISVSDFVARARRTTRQIKAALLDQSFLAGIGNIYADESLYAARIHPKQLTSRISKTKLMQLHTEIQAVLSRALSLMGSSVDSYTGVNGQPGKFQKYLSVYAHEGKPCPGCGAQIIREKIGARSAHFCPRCQRLR